MNSPPAISMHRQDQNWAWLANKKHINLLKSYEINKPGVGYEHLSNVLKVVLLAAVLFTTFAPFFMPLPKWTIWPVIGGGFAALIPMYKFMVKKALVENGYKKKIKFFELLGVAFTTNLSTHLVKEGDLPSRDPRIRSDQDHVKRVSTKDFEAVKRKYGLVDSPGEKALVMGRFVELEDEGGNEAPSYLDGVIIKIERFAECLNHRGKKPLKAERFYFDENEPFASEFNACIDGAIKSPEKRDEYIRQMVELYHKASHDLTQALLKEGIESHCSRIGQPVQKKDEPSRDKVLETVKRRIAYLREYIEDTRRYKYHKDLNKIQEAIPANPTLQELKSIEIQLFNISIRIKLHFDFSQKTFWGTREIEPFQMPQGITGSPKDRLDLIYRTIRDTDKEIVKREWNLNVLILVVTTGIIVMAALLHTDKWMNLMIVGGMFGFGLGTGYAHKIIERMRKQIRYLKMNEYLLENPKMLNRLPPLPQIMRLKKLGIDPLTCIPGISTILVDQ